MGRKLFKKEKILAAGGGRQFILGRAKSTACVQTVVGVGLKLGQSREGGQGTSTRIVPEGNWGILHDYLCDRGD